MTDEELLARLNPADRREFFTLSPEKQAYMRYAMTQNIPPTEELQDLTRQLYARMRGREGVILGRARLEGAMPRACGVNARLWVRAHPGDAVVCGYLYFDFERRLPHVRFTPHVVVRTQGGDWLDVTPHENDSDHPFLPHVGTDEEFDAALALEQMDLVYR